MQTEEGERMEGKKVKKETEHQDTSNFRDLPTENSC